MRTSASASDARPLQNSIAASSNEQPYDIERMIIPGKINIDHSSFFQPILESKTDIETGTTFRISDKWSREQNLNYNYKASAKFPDNLALNQSNFTGFRVRPFSIKYYFSY